VFLVLFIYCLVSFSLNFVHRHWWFSQMRLEGLPLDGQVKSLSREHYWRGRLSTIDLLIKLACFVKRINKIFNRKNSWSKLVIRRRSMVQTFPVSKDSLLSGKAGCPGHLKVAPLGQVPTRQTNIRPGWKCKKVETLERICPEHQRRGTKWYDVDDRSPRPSYLSPWLPLAVLATTSAAKM